MTQIHVRRESNQEKWWQIRLNQVGREKVPRQRRAEFYVYQKTSINEHTETGEHT